MWSNDPDVPGGVASETPRGLYATYRSNKRDRLWRHRAFRERGAMWDWHLESKWPNLKVTGGNWRSQMGPCDKKTESFTPSRVGGSQLILREEVTCSFSRQVDGWILRLTMISMIGCAVLMAWGAFMIRIPDEPFFPPDPTKWRVNHIDSYSTKVEELRTTQPASTQPARRLSTPSKGQPRYEAWKTVGFHWPRLQDYSDKWRFIGIPLLNM